MAAQYWGGFQLRIVLTFAAGAVAWTAVVGLGVKGIVPLWLGLILNTILASMFYMPMHEATHGNIMGRRPGSRRGEDLIGMACSVPLGFSYLAHRISHMRHHAFTNDPDRDPDHYTDGPLRALPRKWLGLMALTTLLPLFAFVPRSRRLLPAQLQRSMGAETDRKGGLIQLRFWALTHLVLLAAFLAGFGWPALLLWYLPGRLQSLWLVFIFAWYPHHPGLHHLFPRVPHYRLPALWQDVAAEMVPKGMRAEGRALESTGPIIW